MPIYTKAGKPASGSRTRKKGKNEGKKKNPPRNKYSKK